MTMQKKGVRHPRRLAVARISFALGAASAGFPRHVRASSREISVAMLIPSEGPQSSACEATRQGVECAIEQANRSGGIKGQSLKLLVMDNNYQPAKTVELIRSLSSKDSVVAVTSLYGGPIITAAIPAATQAGLPIIGVQHGGDVFRAPGTEILFHVRAAFDAEFRAIGSLFTTLGRRKCAVLHATDKSGLAFLAQFESTVKPLGLSIVAAVPYERDVKDYSAHIRAAANSGADLLMVGGVTGPGISAIRAKVDARLPAQLVCLSTVDERFVWRELGVDAIGTAFSTIVPNPYSTLLPLAREYQVAVAAQRNAVISLSSFEGYINTRVLLEAMRRSPSIDRTSLMAALRSMRAVSIGGVGFTGPGAGATAGINAADILMLTRDGRMLR